MGELAAVTHHQKIAHAAAMFAEIDDLRVDLVGYAAKQDARVDQFVSAATMHVHAAAVLGEAARRRLAAHHPRVVLDWEITRRIAERQMHAGAGAQLAGGPVAPPGRLPASAA